MDSKLIGLLIRTCLLIIVAAGLSHVIRTWINTSSFGRGINRKFMANILIVILWIVIIGMIVTQFDSLARMTNALLAGSGIIAVIVGLGAQESFANVFSGLFISLFKPFDIGDRIRIVGDDTAGFVEDITLRHTVIRTYMNVRVIIPNAVMGTAKIENSTYAKGASYPIEITVAYENKEKRHRALEIMEEVVTGHPKFYDRRTPEQIAAGVKASEALCVATAESGITLKILVWTEHVSDNNKTVCDCRMEILDRFEEEGIEIPYNKLVLVEAKKDQ